MHRMTSRHFPYCYFRHPTPARNENIIKAGLKAGWPIVNVGKPLFKRLTAVFRPLLIKFLKSKFFNIQQSCRLFIEVVYSKI